MKKIFLLSCVFMLGCSVTPDVGNLYLGEVLCSYYSVESRANAKLKNATGGHLKNGNPYYSAAADWSWLPVDTVFMINNRIYIIDDYSKDLVGTKNVELYDPYATLSEIQKLGANYHNLRILRWGDEEKTSEILLRKNGYHFVDIPYNYVY